MATLFVLWFFCPIACAVIAHIKQRSIVAWFFSGLVFGIFALLAIAFASKKDEAIEYFDGISRKRYLPGHKDCPYCAEQIRIEAIKCKHCHSDLAATAVSRGLPAEVRQ